MVRVVFVLVGNRFQELEFDGKRRFPFGQADAIGDSENVRINSDRWFTKCGVKYDIGCFSANAGQGFERFSVVRHFAVVAFDELAAGGYHVRGFGAIKTDTVDVLDKAILAKVQNGLRRWCRGEEFARGEIDALVGCLRRQDYCDKQLKRTRIFQLGGWRRVCRAQTLKYFSALANVHRKMCLRLVATSGGDRGGRAT